MVCIFLFVKNHYDETIDSIYGYLMLREKEFHEGFFYAIMIVTKITVCKYIGPGNLQVLCFVCAMLKFINIHDIMT